MNFFGLFLWLWAGSEARAIFNAVNKTAFGDLLVMLITSGYDQNTASGANNLRTFLQSRFAAFFTPKPGEQPVVVKEQRFFFDRKINDKKITRTMFLPLIFLSNPILQLNEVRGRT